MHNYYNMNCDDMFVCINDGSVRLDNDRCLVFFKCCITNKYIQITMHCKNKIVKITHSGINTVVKKYVDLNFHDAYCDKVHVITTTSYLL